MEKVEANFSTLILRCIDRNKIFYNYILLHSILIQYLQHIVFYYLHLSSLFDAFCFEQSSNHQSQSTRS